MKYNYNLEIRNETDKDEIFKKYKQSVYEHILAEIGDSFDFGVDLLVIFRKIDRKRKLINGETYNAGTTLIEGKYAIILNIASLEKLPYDGGCDLAISIRHELCHVRDIYVLMNNKHYSVNPALNNHNTLKDFTISKGWLFWTEFHAYYITYKTFKDEYECITFLEIEKAYAKLKKQLVRIKNISDFETKKSKTMLRNFKESIEDFIYLIAKYLGGCIFKDDDAEHDEVTENEFSERIGEICRKSLNKLSPLVRKDYGKGLAKKLYNLGKYLLTDIYEEFNMFTIDQEGSILFAYCD